MGSSTYKKILEAKSLDGVREQRKAKAGALQHLKVGKRGRCEQKTLRTNGK